MLFLLVATLASNAGAANLLSNPGFEIPALNDGEWVEAFPDPWFRMDPYGNYRHGNPLASELTPYEGEQVMEVSNNCPLDQYVSVPGGLQADTEYTFTVHCMRPSWETGNSYMRIAIGYGGWSGYFPGPNITHNSESWGEYSISFDTAVDGGVGATQLNVEAWNREGTLVFDGMSLVIESITADTPQPTNGAIGVSRVPTLSWTAGDGALSHHVYFGTNYDDVNNATNPNLPPIGRGILPVGTETYIPSENPLEFATTYFWRIDEVNATETVKGKVWSFTVMNKPIPFLLGDLNLDSEVNLQDVKILTEYWLQEPVCFDASCPDLGGSSKVDIYDFSLMANNWDKKIEPLVISEFLASNGSNQPLGEGDLLDEDGDSSDWIEIYNLTGSTIDLDGWYLTDDADDLTKWQFPNETLLAGCYLMVFASGKDRSVAGSELHTNFNLSVDGEYLALVCPDGTIATEYNEYEYADEFGYPPQKRDISYGFHNNQKRYFGTPTPGAENDNPFIDFVADTKFDHNRGFYETPFEVKITCDTLGAVIYYTTDGSEPSQASTPYTGPVPINTTTCLRAKAFKPDWLPTNVDTQTYIFLADVIHQPANPPGFPTSWNGSSPDYEMDSDIVDDPSYSDTIIDDLKTIPSVSIVMDVDDLFGSSGIYSNPTEEGFAWERPASLGLIYPDGSEGFQVNCGMRLAGRWTRSPSFKKRSFRALFKDLYGPTNLLHKLFPDSPVESFNTIVFRGTSDIAWTDPRGNLLEHALYTRDQWAHDTERDMEQITSHGRFVHIYLNGLYWGLYNALERPDAAFMAEYCGGDDKDYDAINTGKVTDGDTAGWDALISLANSGGSRGYDNDWYQDMQGWLDIENLTDYVLNQFYNSNIDWPGRNGNNWRVASIRIQDENGTPMGADFKTFTWDAEASLADGYESDDAYWDPIAHFNNYNNTPARLYATLIQNPDYQMLFADHAHKHLFNNGVLTVAKATERFMARQNEIDRAIVGESARWGDHCVEPPPTRDDWITEQNRLLTDYFPLRTDVLIGYLKNHGLYPNIDAPVFNQHGGHVPQEFDLTMSASETILYTLDGSDPRELGGGINPGAATYSGAIPLTESAIVKARCKNGNTWSALNEAVFAVGPVKENLRITEIMYHPPDPPQGDPNTEFIELLNIGTESINLALVRFINGIDFEFPSLPLTPGEYVVVARDPTAFNAHYPWFSGLIAGKYNGVLNNGGERVELVDALGAEIHNFRYEDDWYPSTDGGGTSLTIRDPNSTDPNDWDRRSGWQASTIVGGTPGEKDTGPQPGDVVINELLSHSDVEVYDWIELRNISNKTINIGGWYLTDSDKDDPNRMKYQIAAGTTLEPNEYIVFYEDQHFGNPADPGTNEVYALSENGEDMFLFYDAGGTLIELAHEDFGASDPDTAFGRYQKSDLDGGVNFVAMSMNTPGLPNAYPPKVGPIVINEFAYNPAGSDNAEFVEFLNISAVPVNLYEDNDPNNPWRFVDDAGDNTPKLEYFFPTGGLAVTLQPGEYFLLVKDEGAFEAAFNDDNDIGTLNVPWDDWIDVSDGNLSNGGEQPQLSKPGEPGYYIRVDRVTYDDDPPWPPEPDGSSDYTLSREVAGNYGNDVINWQSAAPTPGH